MKDNSSITSTTYLQNLELGVPSASLSRKQDYRRPLILVIALFFSVIINLIIILLVFSSNELSMGYIAAIISLTIFSIFFVYYGATFFITPIINALYLKSQDKVNLADYGIKYFPYVAILYTTCDDFDQKAIRSCLDQDYPHFHVFILDDSKQEGYSKKIDMFVNVVPNRVSLIRRNSSQGYKAGNINNALKFIESKFKLLLIVDADEIIPKSFLRNIVAKITLKDNIGFVQASSKGREDNKNPFAHDLRYFVEMYWTHFLPLKDLYGFSTSLGHGVLFRRDVLEKIGGFPEVVSEDIALTLAMRRIGFEGIHTVDVFGYESFPPDLAALRKRQFRWAKADLEICAKKLGIFLTSENISWTERLDAITRECKLPLTALMPLSFILGGVLRYCSIKLPMSSWFIGIPAILLILGLSPMLCYSIHLRRSPIVSIRFICQWFFAAVNLSLLHSLAVVSYLIQRNVIFLPTGAPETHKEKRKSLIKIFFSSSPNDPLLLSLEMVFGVFLFIIAAISMEFTLLALALTIIGLIPVLKLGWRHPISKIFQMVPFPLLLVAGVADILSGNPSLPTYLALTSLAMVLV